MSRRRAASIAPTGTNLVLADCRCNGDKADRLAAFDHLQRWCERNQRPQLVEAFEKRLFPHELHRTQRIASWAYLQAEHVGAGVWQRGRDELTRLDHQWRDLPGMTLGVL